MKKLVYASKRRCDDPAEIDRMVGRAREANRADGLTGLLLVDDRRFLQLLEGDHDAVARCFLRIARSTLHTDIEIGVFEDSSMHLFAGWEVRRVDPRDPGPSLGPFWRRVMAAPEPARLELVERFFLDINAVHRLPATPRSALNRPAPRPRTLCKGRCGCPKT